MTVKEILDSNSGDAYECHECLESFLIKKLNDIDGVPDDYDHPSVTDVERNFIFISEQERGFLIDSSIFDDSPDLEKYAGWWSEVGMRQTDYVIRACAKLSRLWDEFGDQPVSSDDEQKTLGDEFNELRRDIEELVSCSFEEKLVKYVTENQDKFCKQDAEGNFI